MLQENQSSLLVLLFEYSNADDTVNPSHVFHESVAYTASVDHAETCSIQFYFGFIYDTIIALYINSSTDKNIFNLSEMKAFVNFTII